MLALVLAGALYGATSLAHGSGFLAVFILGLAFGRRAHAVQGRDRALLRLARRASPSSPSSSRSALTIDIGGLSGEIWLDGIVLALVLALLARPLVVLLTLGLARLSWAERGVHRLERPEGRGADPAGRVRRARRRRRSRPGVRARLRRRAPLGRGQGTLVPLRRPSARDPDARAARTAVGAVGQARRGAAGRARVRGRAPARAWWAARSASFRSASTRGSRSSSGTAPRPGPAARSNSRPAIACCSSPTPTSSKRWRGSSPTRRGSPDSAPRRQRPLAGSLGNGASPTFTAPFAGAGGPTPLSQPQMGGTHVEVIAFAVSRRSTWRSTRYSCAPPRRRLDERMHAVDAASCS